MKTVVSKIYLLWLVLLTHSLTLGCGTLVGNPKKPSENGGESTNMIALPDFSFDVPETLLSEGDGAQTSGLYLTDASDFKMIQTSRFTLMHSYAYRMFRTISQTKRIIRHIAEQDQVNRAGAHLGKGETRDIDVVLAENDTEAAYPYEALFCLQGEPFIQLQWKEGEVRAIRSLRRAPDQDLTDVDYAAEYIITATDDGYQTQYFANGLYPAPATPELDGPILREYIRHTVKAGGVVTIEAVSDRYRDDQPVGGDIYAIAQLSVPDNTGSFLAYHKGYPAICGDKSVEAEDLPTDAPLFIAPDVSQFCLGRVIGDTTNFTPMQRLQEFAKLKELSVPSYQNIRQVEFDTQLTCPQ